MEQVKAELQLANAQELINVQSTFAPRLSNPTTYPLLSFPFPSTQKMNEKVSVYLYIFHLIFTTDLSSFTVLHQVCAQARSLADQVGRGDLFAFAHLYQAQADMVSVLLWLELLDVLHGKIHGGELAHLLCSHCSLIDSFCLLFQACKFVFTEIS